MIPILQMEKMKLRETKELTHSHAQFRKRTQFYLHV